MADTLYPDLEQRYDVLKKKAQQQAAEQSAQEQEALKRRFASMGMSGSGEAAKQEQLALQRGGQQAATAGEAIEAQKMAEVGQREYAGQVRKEEQAFAAGESEKQRGFAKQEALDQRAFAALENQYGREFAANQSKLERGQKQRMFNAQLAFQKKQNKWQEDLAYKNYDLDYEISQFNKKMAEDAANKKGYMEHILNPGGLLDKMGIYQERGLKW